ncbi:hypothetical protein QZH41_010082, partial [Actinostola sp. cb2023]
NYDSIIDFDITCAVVDCLPDFTCKMINGFPKCIPIIDGGDCDFACPDIFRPVCGSDGKTYGNECELKRAACKQNKKITVARREPCPPSCAAVSCVLPRACQVINNRAQCVCPRFCPTIYAPVCGSDGVTYSNRCFLNIAACKNKNIKFVGAGPCPSTTPAPTRKPCPDACIQLFDPVCGSDNKTYSNVCFLGIEKCKNNPSLRVMYRGSCVPGCEGVSCPAKDTSCHVVKGRPQCGRECHPCVGVKTAPVCGSNDKTYTSICELGRAACKSQKKITVVKKGACNHFELSTRHTTHAHGTRYTAHGTWHTAQGRWYMAHGTWHTARGTRHTARDTRHTARDVCHNYKCTFPPYSKCQSVNGRRRCVCKFLCPQKQDLVCGSDGKTYNNVCIMKRTSCRRKRRITIASKALCKNPCFQAKPCTSPPYSFCRPINGKAKCVCNRFCTKIYRPVCGSDNKTYGNLCMLKAASCSQNKLITVKRPGKCVNVCHNYKCTFPPHSKCESVNGRRRCVCKFLCPQKQDLVCGSDGKTYDNVCVMKRTSCRRKRRITIASKALCKNPCRLVRCGYYAVCKVNKYNKAVCVCNTVCTKIYKPVCGSDGKTYSNVCLMKAASCKQKKYIRVAYQGVCRKPY